QRAVHPAYGVTVLTIDANGAKTSTSIDGFGRQKSASASGEATETWSYFYVPTGGMAVRRDIDHGGFSISSFDYTGRLVERTGLDSNAQMVVSALDYSQIESGADDSPIFVSQPHHPADVNVPQSVFRLDNLGRVVSVAKAGNETPATVQYNGLTTVVTDENGGMSRVTVDSLGRPINSATIGDNGRDVL